MIEIKTGKELKIGDVLKAKYGAWRIYGGMCPVFKIVNVASDSDIDSCIIEPEHRVEIQVHD